jgi:hypothetical protein
MASKNKKAKAAGAAAAVKGKPYVQRVIQDEELRDNVRSAFEAAQDAYNRLSNGKSPQKALANDKKLHKDLKEAATALRDAGQALREGPKKKKRGFGRKLLLLIIGGSVALVVSEELRTKVLDALFGKEEEFEYSSTTSPPSPAPSGSASAA